MEEEKNKLELLKALVQAASDVKYNKTNALKREKTYTNFEVVDNFNVKVAGNSCRINYSQLVIGKNFSESHLKCDIEKTFADIVKYLKDEVKKSSGKSLTFKEDEKDCQVESVLQININKQIRNYTKCYTIKQLKEFLISDENDE